MDVASGGCRRLASHGDGLVQRGRVVQAEAQMLAVVDGFVQEPGDVIVVEGVNGGLALPRTGDQTEVAEQAQLVGNRGVFHADVGRELGDRTGLAAQPGQDQQPAGGSQRLHGLRDRGRRGGI
jgi:hypothetical protein